VLKRRLPLIRYSEFRYDFRLQAGSALTVLESACTDGATGGRLQYRRYTVPRWSLVMMRLLSLDQHRKLLSPDVLWVQPAVGGLSASFVMIPMRKAASGSSKLLGCRYLVLLRE
jgi:hypothetical protein